MLAASSTEESPVAGILRVRSERHSLTVMTSVKILSLPFTSRFAARD